MVITFTLPAHGLRLRPQGVDEQQDEQDGARPAEETGSGLLTVVFMRGRRCNGGRHHGGWIDEIRRHDGVDGHPRREGPDRHGEQEDHHRPPSEHPPQGRQSRAVGGRSGDEEDQRSARGQPGMDQRQRDRGRGGRADIERNPDGHGHEHGPDPTTESGLESAGLDQRRDHT